MRVLFVMAIFLVSGCVSKQIAYQPIASLSPEDTKSVIEQLVMEQPIRHRPVSVVVEKDFVELNDGVYTRSDGRTHGVIVFGGVLFASGDNREVSKEVRKRLYYNTMGVIKLYQSGKWYVVQVLDTDNRLMQNFYTRDIAKSQRFIDALTIKKDTLKALPVEPTKPENNKEQ